MVMHFTPDVQDKSVSSNRTGDRVIVLEKISGEKTKNASGLLDERLFVGTNKLHAIMDPETCHWSMKYEKGITPEVLKNKFTTFVRCYNHAKDYFENRGVSIKEVIG